MATECRAEHVGSLLRPPEVLRARAEQARGEITAERLRELEDQAALSALELQREAGIGVFTEGEVRRATWMAAVQETVDGLVEAPYADVTPWRRDADGVAPAEEVAFPITVVEERLRRKPSPNLMEIEAAFLAEHAPGPYKITMASPMMSRMFWRPGQSDSVYPRSEDVIADMVRIQVQDVEVLVDLGVSWIQLDALGYMGNIDPSLPFAPEDLAANLELAINADNTVFRAARARNPEITLGMHFCRGNNRSAWVGQGGYEPIAERVFTEVEVDRFLLEYDTERAGGFEPLRFVPPGRTVVLGLISSKIPELESVDDLRRRIDQAAKYLPLEQLALSPQCGFASTARGNLLTVDEQRRKLELVVRTAAAVWG